MKQTFHCAKVYVRLKKGVLDPQGITVKQALETLGYRGIQDVRIGRLIEIRFNGKTKSALKKAVQEMGMRLLANPIIEEFEYEIGEP